MPDFRLIPTLSGSLVRWEPWNDPELDSASAFVPSRLNARPDVPHSFLRVSRGTTLEILAEVGGVLGPLDAALGGRLFTWSWVDHPDLGLASPIPFTLTAGQSSRVQIPSNAIGPEPQGHYAIMATRTDGGAQIVPFELISPL